MSREVLLRTLSAAALAALVVPDALASTAPVINGGGATSPQGDYAGPNNPNTGAPTSEFATFDAAQSTVQFGTYWGSGSTGQTAFLNNDLTCDINKVTGANSGKCANTPGGADVVHYNFSDSALTAAQIAQWSTSSWGQAAAGNLIQIPALGTAEAIIINDTNVKKNGQLRLTDSDLCEIFSGGYTDFSQITDSGTAFKPAVGQFQLVYRGDAAGTTFILTEHLARVCTSADTPSGITFTPTTTFATLFSGVTGGIAAAIPGSIAETGNSGVANYLAGLTSSGKIAQAISYASPDWTSVPVAPDTLLSNGKTSPLLVAAVYRNGAAYLPNTAGIAKALAHVTVTDNGVTLPPSTAAEGANPAAWVPIVQDVSIGYPIVGYGTLDLPQCYSNPTIAAGIKAFLTDHYNNAAYKAIQTNNGLVSVANTGAAKFVAKILAEIVKDGGWHTGIQDKTRCAGLAGR